MKISAMIRFVLFTSMGLPPMATFVIKSTSKQFKSACNQDEYTPCACRSTLTGVMIHKNGKLIPVEYMESVCIDNENRKRVEEGIIKPDYFCHQLKQEFTIQEDMHGDPVVDVTVNRRSGCELRCVNKHCGAKRDIGNNDDLVLVLKD